MPSGLSTEKKYHIRETLKQCLRQKFKQYSPETLHMPFHYRLLGKDRMALFSFIHSLNTTFGTSIFEPIAYELARGRFKIVKTHIKPHNEMSSIAQHVIQDILDELINATRQPDHLKELHAIQKVCQDTPMKKIKPGLVDIWLEDTEDNKYLIDMKTVKPNIEGFIGYKRKLLEWIALELNRDPNVKVHPMIGIPYNPYEPKPYDRWTMRGMFDLKHEVLVAEEFWNFIGGEGAYTDLLDCFEQTGIELRPEMDQYFQSLINSNASSR